MQCYLVSLGHHWNTQSRGEAQPHGTEERFKNSHLLQFLQLWSPATHRASAETKFAAVLLFQRKQVEMSNRLPLPTLFLHMLCSCCLIQLLPEKGIPKSLAPSMWEWIQFSVLVCFLEGLFPRQFNQPLSEHNIYVLVSNLPHQRVRTRTTHSGEKYPLLLFCR